MTLKALDREGMCLDRRLKVLVCAHEFSPAHGSECAVGWNIASRLAAFHDVTVLAATGSQRDPRCYRDAYKEHVDNFGPVAGLKVCFIDQPALSRACAWVNVALTKMADGAGFRPLFYAALRAWQRAAYETGNELGFEKFDVVHQLTPIGFRNPGYLWRSRRPFVIGPISGTYSVPLRFARSLGMRSCLFEMTRALSNSVQSRGRIRSAVRASDFVWVVTAADEILVRCANTEGFARMVEAGAPEVEPVHRSYTKGETLKLCWSGRHDAAKVLPLLLRAIAVPNVAAKVHLTVLGSGPMTASWRTTAERLGLHSIDWKGWQPHNEAIAELRKAHVLVHTSIREGTPHVILEALALGLPVICHDACGMATVINDQCGIKVPLLCPEDSVRGVRDAIQKLLETPELLGRLSAGAISRSRDLTWEAKAKEIAETYMRVVQTATSRAQSDVLTPRIEITDEIQ